MSRRLWLHIGAEKTGTTSIQSCLALNRDALRQRGVLVPQSAGRHNHVALAAYAMSDERGIEELRIGLGVTALADLPAFRRQLRRELPEEVEASGARTVVLTNEHCSSRLRSREEVERLRKLLARVTDDVRVLLYIRDPVALHESWYSTLIASGGTSAFPHEPEWRAADWLAMAQRWEGVFGREALVLRRMDPAALRGGDLLADFFTTVGLADFAFTPAPRKNEMLPLKALKFLRLMNARLPWIVDNRMNPARGPLSDVMRAFPERQRFRVSADVAARIRDHYAESYETLRALYFPDVEGPLFTEQGRPAADELAAAEAPLTMDDMADLAAFLWAHRR